ncbi:hypothetical protein K439DRAFT_1622576 [Ramaria rubella]|nr:hypothetical protein K439DRAFT_1622576 [Ramaria rubella]
MAPNTLSRVGNIHFCVPETLVTTNTTTLTQLYPIVFHRGFLALRVNYSLAERTAQVACLKLFFRVVPLPPSKMRTHFCAFEPQSATLQVTALPAKVLIPSLVQN